MYTIRPLIISVLFAFFFIFCFFCGSTRRRPDTADRRRLYAVKLKLFYPRVFFIPDRGTFLDQHTVKRNIYRPYLRLLTYIAIRKLRPVSAGKTYRHLRLGGSASGLVIVGQKDYVPEAEHLHVFDGVIVESYHRCSLAVCPFYSFTKWSSLPWSFISFATSRVLMYTVAVLSQGWIPISLFSKSLST